MQICTRCLIKTNKTYWLAETEREMEMEKKNCNAHALLHGYSVSYFYGNVFARASHIVRIFHVYLATCTKIW